MTLARAADSPPADGWGEAEDLLDRFEAAWQKGHPPALEALLAMAAKVLPSPVLRRKFLEEVVKIDLTQRWRRAPKPSIRGSNVGAPPPPRLEEYARRLPELTNGADLSLELIGEEYWVRHRWGDRPSPEEYAARFPRLGNSLRAALRRIDGELAAEGVAGAGRPPIPASVLPEPPVPTEAAPSVPSVAALLGTLHQHGLLDRARIDEANRELVPRCADGRALARELMVRKWLTPYQANQLLLGRGAELVIGPYHLLERLGEGGVGQVFKARDRRGGGLCSLKIIRKELVDDPEVVARFYREIDILGQLRHPNIVQRFEAGPIGAMHVLAMEYVEGIDLARLVKYCGPVPAGHAIEWIRQAAVGLQHAHEHGLVHRDIKPANLLVAKSPGSDAKPARLKKKSHPSGFDFGLWTYAPGLVKVLDLGLARLRRPLPKGPSEALTLVTRMGAVLMGTPDFLAPEQAVDFHCADVRADIYSLGCTLFFLLTGQPPFPGGSLGQKLLRHREAEPPPLEQVRPDLPPALGPVVRKMLAKRPEDRYQTPGEVAQALAALKSRPAPPVKVARYALPNMDQLWQRRRLLIGAGGALLLSSLGLWGVVRWRSAGKGRADDSPSATLSRLRAQLDGPKPDFDQLRQGLVQLRAKHPATPEARAAAELLMQVPAPLDQLSPQIATGAVAVVGAAGVKPLLCVAISPDGKFLAAGGEDNLVHLWQADTGKEIAALPGFKSAVHAVAFSPRGDLLVATGSDGLVRTWTLAGRELESLKGAPNLCLAYAPDGSSLAVGGSAAVVKVWALPERRERTTLAGQTQPVLALAYSPDSQLIASAGLNGTVMGWDVASGRVKISARPTAMAHALAFAPDGKTLAIGCQEGAVRLWDVAADKELNVLQGTQPQPILSVAFGPDGKFLASVDRDGEVVAWDVASGRRLRQWNLAGKATRVVFTGDGRHLVTANANGTLYILRLAAPPRR